jgi:predicted aspartyl protease
MGMTEIRVRLVNLADSRRAAEIDMIVDSGAIFSVVPSPVLRGIGVEPGESRTFRLASRASIRRGVGNVLYDIDGRTGAAPVVFGRRGDASLLGVVTLEALGLRLDPLRRTLHPLKLMIA